MKTKNKIIIILAVIAVIALGTIGIISSVRNNENPEVTMPTAAATLPNEGTEATTQPTVVSMPK